MLAEVSSQAGPLCRQKEISSYPVTQDSLGEITLSRVARIMFDFDNRI